VEARSRGPGGEIPGEVKAERGSTAGGDGKPTHRAERTHRMHEPSKSQLVTTPSSTNHMLACCADGR